ncbi:1-acylglycerol-3-phosphate O-acyltransferase PNPLA3 [Suncus etruscus]|uniref:1-acylglycerol-3-phosphate O-acyltransferase PNPLA3 n=1 Tax=Suncus etruscus TaxID=109475 RepID=UPI00210F35AD|nr:1-acylglycerol-3-phosphate O-acyltransferase PNPLA3 [Suncus etruscus]
MFMHFHACVSVSSRRLVTWLPDFSDDIQWLNWAVSHVCSQVLKRLVPATRSQVPADGQQPSQHRLDPGPAGHSRPLYPPTDPDPYPGDCPVGSKAEAAQCAMLRASLTLLSGSVSVGTRGDSCNPLCPMETF